MTQVHFAPVGNGTTTPIGYIEGRPVGSGTLPDSFRAVLIAGEVTVDVEPTDDDSWCWNIVERVDYGRNEYVQVDDDPGTVQYDSLTKVDGDDFSPTVPVAPAWQSGMAALQAEVDQKADQTDVDAGYSALNAAQGNLATALTAVADLANTKREDPYRFDSTHGRAARLAIGKRGTSPFDVLGIGASWLAGSGAGSPPAGRFLDLAQAKARVRWPVAGVAGGLGYRESYSFTSGWVSPYAISTTTGANGTTTTFGLGRKTVTLKVGNTVTITLPAGSTGIRVLYGKGPTGGNFTWTKNGGGATTLSGLNATAITVPLDLVGVAGDVFVITATTAAWYFQGGMFFGGDETKGIRFWGGATSGYKTTDFVDGLGLSYDAWTLVDPDVIVLGDMLANDYAAAVPVPVATSTANLTTLVTAARARCTKPPTIVLMLLPEIIATGTPLAPWATYRQAALDWAKADTKVAVWDVAPLFGTMLNPDTYGAVNGDQAHPNAGAHEALAEDFVNLLAAA